MKIKWFFLLSVLPFKGNESVKNNHPKESIQDFAEEMKAWLLVAGFFVGIVWIVSAL